MVLVSFLTFTLFICGCGSKRELNELAIVLAMGIDKVEEGYEVSLQVVNPNEVSSKQGGSGRAPVVTYYAKGKSIFEAIRRSTTITPRKPYFAHIQILILGEELAKEGISESLDFFLRDNELRSDFFVIVSDETTAREVLGIFTPLEKIPANKLFSSLEVSGKSWAPSTSVHVHDLVNELSTKEKNSILPNISILGDAALGMNQSNVEKIEPPAKLKYTGLAVIKQDKLAGILTEDESKGYNYLKNNVKSTVAVISCPEEGELAMEISSVKTKLKGKVKNGFPSIDVKIRVEQNVGEVNCSIDLTKKKTRDYINNKTTEQIKKNIEETLVTFQNDYQIDVLGFGEAIRRADHKAWNKMKEEWVELFPNVEVNVSVDVKTTGTGTKVNSILHEEKE
ncbi:Ger(x)C family spore germination protein [Solibacillus sp. FSL H8-0538]|uniref:Ger(x)C family spore germination protein n=1 Tax=Solibacillus sp. FSL H8-0538 TaxID=2921400 RepID=UPI0030F82399